jgi:hypothetical protein
MGPYVYLHHSQVNKLQTLCSTQKTFFSTLTSTNTYLQQYEEIIQKKARRKARL